MLPARIMWRPSLQETVARSAWAAGEANPDRLRGRSVSTGRWRHLQGWHPVDAFSGRPRWRGPARQVLPGAVLCLLVGCGDCLAAGIAVFLDSPEVLRTAGSRAIPDMVLAVRFGMAAAAVNVEDVRPARLTLEAAERKLQDVTFDQIR